jgi:hypothetical protein
VTTFSRGVLHTSLAMVVWHHMTPIFIRVHHRHRHQRHEKQNTLRSQPKFPRSFRFRLSVRTSVLHGCSAGGAKLRTCAMWHATGFIDFIISSSIRNYFGSNLCRPFALGLWIFYRGRPPRIMARLAFLNELVNMPDVLPLASGGFLELDNGRRSGSR